jgi:anti-sigma28 factor (negative regulator of flagellin synthesis)
MVTIHGVGGVPEPTPDRSSGARDKRRDNNVNSEGGRKDGVDISSQGHQAADIARIKAIADQEPDIRPDRVEQARQAIDNGAHKDEGVIVEIAKRLENLLS